VLVLLMMLLLLLLVVIIMMGRLLLLLPQYMVVMRLQVRREVSPYSSSSFHPSSYSRPVVDGGRKGLHVHDHLNLLPGRVSLFIDRRGFTATAATVDAFERVTPAPARGLLNSYL